MAACPLDTPTLPVNHCSQSTVFGALNRKGRGTHRDRKTAQQAERQHNVNSAGYIITDGAEKNEGLVIAVLASAI